VVALSEAAILDSSLLGAKAANLGRLASAGFPVPPGFVVTTAAEGCLREAFSRMLEAAAALGAERFAVRSSGTAEDLEDASFAGQYETLLNVRPEDVPEAVEQVFDSASASRVSAYKEDRAGATGEATRSRMAVLVQTMVGADSAGVAFTANPVTGARGEVVITAVRGLGERFVSGEAVGDEWVVRGTDASCTRASEAAITAEQAADIAALARRAEEYFGSPQDIEWAISAGRLYLLQARPMTALPETVDWIPPTPRYWMRNFRLGEWLPEAMTPLFADWLLELIEQGYLRGMRSTVGTAVPFQYAAINGWYYTTLPEVSPRLLARALVESRGRMIPIMWNALIRVNNDPVGADRAVLGRLADQWRTEILPRYRRMVATAEERVGAATPAELVGIVDEVGTAAGEYLFSLAMVGGAAWKMEAPSPSSFAGTSRTGWTSATRCCCAACLVWTPERCRTPCRASTGTDPPSANSASRARTSMVEVRGSTRFRPSGKLQRGRAAPPSATGPSCSLDSTRSLRCRNGTPSCENGRPATSPSPGPCCAVVRSGWARASQRGVS
jgi:pyruvate,water dikinase